MAIFLNIDLGLRMEVGFFGEEGDKVFDGHGLDGCRLLKFSWLKEGFFDLGIRDVVLTNVFGIGDSGGRIGILDEEVFTNGRDGLGHRLPAFVVMSGDPKEGPSRFLTVPNDPLVERFHRITCFCCYFLDDTRTLDRRDQNSIALAA